uniref:Putative e3 ubiquitin-protein ligase trim33 n=1 Tax=Anopheles triannulatus TaxID=58253 RepID=A0A2M4ACW3_9DIPT
MTLVELYSSFQSNSSGTSSNGSGANSLVSSTSSAGGSSGSVVADNNGIVAVSSGPASAIADSTPEPVGTMIAASPSIAACVSASIVPTATVTVAGAVSPASSSGVSLSPRPDQLGSKSSPSPSSSMFAESFKLDDMLELENVANGSLSENGSTGYQLDHGSLSDLMDQDCSLCQNKFTSPRVLSCLHVFCEPCLDKLLAEGGSLNTGGEKKQDLLGGSGGGTIACPICKQITAVGPKGAAGLHQDYILSNVLDLSTIEPSQLACTSCKSKEMAISRCNNCANFLCDSCEYAHQHMRCFEHHKVVQLNDLRKSSEKVHKTLYCSVHPIENLKYFCFNCQMPVCNECLLGEHKGSDHNYQIISEAEKPMRQELENSMREAKSKIEYCNHASSKLESSLHELQSQFETARGLINESFQSFKAVLEQCCENALKNLEKLHSERELKIMDLYENVEKSVEKIEVATKYARKVLDQGNGPELLSLKNMICKQLGLLMGTAPKVDVNFSIEFQSNYEKFEQIVPELFGSFRTEATLLATTNETTPPPTLPGVPIMVNDGQPSGSGGVGGASCGLTQGPLTASVTASSPISLPTSMQSSFDGDMSTLGAGGYMLPNVLTPEPSNGPTAGTAAITANPLAGTPTPVGVGAAGGPGGPAATIPGLTSIAEYNLHRLANLAESSSNDMTDSIVPVNTTPSTTTNFTLADLISGNQHAIQALAKYSMGSQELNSGPMLTPHSTLDTVPMMNDYPVMAGTTSPILPVTGSMPPLEGAGVLNGGDMGAMNRFQPSMCVNGRTKATPMQIRCKFGSLGQTKGQFNSPHGFCLGVDEEIVVADTNNHRIEIFEKNGTFKFSFGVPGKEEGQLFYPRKVAVMRASAKFVVCDRGNERSRMQIFSKNGHFIKKIAIRYIDILSGVWVFPMGFFFLVCIVFLRVFFLSAGVALLYCFSCVVFLCERSGISLYVGGFFFFVFLGACVSVFFAEGAFLCLVCVAKIFFFSRGVSIFVVVVVLFCVFRGVRFSVLCSSRGGVLWCAFSCASV